MTNFLILMKKSIFLILAVLLSVALFAQPKTVHFKLNWTQSETFNGNNSYHNNSLYFNGAKSMGSTGLLPYFYIEIPLNENETIKNISISNRTEDSFLVDTSFYENVASEIKENYTPESYLTTINNKPAIVIFFSAIKTNILPMMLDRLISFDLNYEIETSISEKGIKKTTNFSEESVMKEGNWYQFKLNTSGIYKLTYEQLSAAGANLANFSASNIKVYGFGGMLSELNNDFRHPDIPEVALKMVDGGDGIFGPGDYFLFYGEGPDSWVYNPFEQIFNHRLNIYSRESYYYVVLSNGEGLRIQQEGSAANANFTVTTFTDYAFKEDETYNLINSGRRWFGDKFEFTTDYNYNFNFDNIVSGSNVYIKTVAAARSTVTSRFNINCLDQANSINISAIPSGSYPSYAVGGDVSWQFNYTGNSKTLPISLSYNQPLTGSVGWLDYIEVNVNRQLIFSGNQLAFRNPLTIKPGRISEFVLQNNSGNDIEIWDISQKTIPKKINYTSSGSNLKFSVATDELKEFLAFNTSSALQLEFVKKIENQNLHAEIGHDYIIISHPDFLDQAEELAQFHRDNSQLDVFVTTLDPIYNEFSSGKQDVSAIRDFIKCVYDQSPSGKRLKYLLLFGDASMDYLKRKDINTNMVPTWEAYESFNPISSISTDDFFGFLDDNEGDLLYDEVNIGIGRFPVVNATEAQQMVDKIKRYKSNHSEVMADWRNDICFIADDEDGNLHIDQANDLSILVDSIYPVGNLDKIFVDAYQQESTPAGQRYPKANEAINERVDKGALIIGYTGHGGEVGWGQERYLDVPDILSWTNYNKLPVFLTATCEFARYDDPDRVSAGELIFLNSKGGGISLFTTARATYAGSNFVVSTNFYQTALKKTGGKYPTMGDIIKATKISSGSGENVMKFILLGDPALTINMPENQVNITSIVNNAIDQETDTIKALSHITVKGNVSNEQNQIMSQFNGYVYPTIYDKPSKITTLSNDDGSPAYEFELQKNILYKGKADVIDGEFEFSYIVPKDIAYKYGNGKISLYAENSETDAAGFDKDIIIGGYDENFTEDEKGPEITLFINNNEFIPGGITDENPVLIAYVTDDNGINTTGNGIGHDITAILDGDENNVKILNNYYVADANSYKSGAISFPYFKLSDGDHRLELKVWDIHNNSNKASIDFVVASSANMALEELFNYPNPLIDYTTFSFEHNQADENLNVTIDIFSLDGKLVTKIEEKLLTDGYRNNQIQWDATDEEGNRITKGMYIYRVSVMTESGKEAQKTAKLVVIK